MQAATWVNPENIMLSEISHHKGQMLYDSTYRRCPEQSDSEIERNRMVPEAGRREK